MSHPDPCIARPVSRVAVRVAQELPYHRFNDLKGPDDVASQNRIERLICQVVDDILATATPEEFERTENYP